MVKGDTEFEGSNIGGDWVIQRKICYSITTLPLVIDDHDMQSHVWSVETTTLHTKTARGLRSTCWEAPEFGHMTLITLKLGKIV